MSKDPHQVIRTLQAHQAVLQAELQEINTDIHLMGQLNNRYHANGVPFDTNLYHLDALRQEKEVILHELSHQINNLYGSLQQSMQLADAVAHTNNHSSSHVHQSLLSNNHNSLQHHQHTSGHFHTNPHHQSVVSVQRSHNGGSFINHSNNHNINHSHHGGGHSHSYCPYGSSIHNSIHNANRSASMMHPPAPGGVTQLNGPGGMAVTTNSSILVHSPRRVFN
eukprot:GFYU01045209.1.p1 GENE.GFYU01045209.1~~GFYU01045209.1.p1  ORF type:complete len:222 (+),score=8.58 GFYU01045209.1:632-1297(+)